MKLGPMLYLVIALALSLIANAFLGWQWAEAGAECETEMVRAAGIAIQNERTRAAKAAKQSGQIVQETKADTSKGVMAGQGNTNEREQAIRTVVVHGDCRMPAGLPRLDQAVDEANAAAGD